MDSDLNGEGSETQDAGPPDSLETVTSNRWFTLAETQDGYGIWARDADRSQAPLARFGEDVDGFAAADAQFRTWTRRMRLFGQLPGILAWIVGVGVVLWIVSTIVNTVWVLVVIGDFPSYSSEFPQRVQTLAEVAYALWVGSLGLMLMLWLWRRSREDLPVV
jgi:hypothetical protein